jgi:hypothetical protein
MLHSKARDMIQCTGYQLLFGPIARLIQNGAIEVDCR